MIDMKKAKNDDPLQRNVEHGLDEMNGCTPFDPPDVKDKYLSMDGKELPGIISQLMEEHKFAISNLDLFEGVLIKFRTNNYVMTDEVNNIFSHFFRYFDEHLLSHNEKEDKVLFPILEKKLLESGEHSTAEIPTTAIDVMQDDHVRIIQLGSIVFNVFGLATRIPDPESRIFVNESAYHSARELIELLKLHIFREDATLFPLAVKLISTDEFELMLPMALKFRTENK